MSAPDKDLEVATTEIRGELPLDSNLANVRSYYCDGLSTILVGDGIVKMGFHEVFPRGDEAVRVQNVVINMPVHRVRQFLAGIEKALQEEGEDERHDD